MVTGTGYMYFHSGLRGTCTVRVLQINKYEYMKYKYEHDIQFTRYRVYCCTTVFSLLPSLSLSFIRPTLCTFLPFTTFNGHQIPHQLAHLRSTFLQS